MRLNFLSNFECCFVLFIVGPTPQECSTLGSRNIKKQYRGVVKGLENFNSFHIVWSSTDKDDFNSESYNVLEIMSVRTGCDLYEFFKGIEVIALRLSRLFKQLFCLTSLTHSGKEAEQGGNCFTPPVKNIDLLLDNAR